MNTNYKCWEKIDELKKQLRQLMELRTKIQIIESIFERMPQCILQMTFLFASFEYKRLTILLKTSLQKLLMTNSIVAIYFIIFGITFYSIIKSMIDLK